MYKTLLFAMVALKTIAIQNTANFNIDDTCFTNLNMANDNISKL